MDVRAGHGHVLREFRHGRQHDVDAAGRRHVDQLLRRRWRRRRRERQHFIHVERRAGRHRHHRHGVDYILGNHHHGRSRRKRQCQREPVVPRAGRLHARVRRRWHHELPCRVRCGHRHGQQFLRDVRHVRCFRRCNGQHRWHPCGQRCTVRGLLQRRRSRHCWLRRWRRRRRRRQLFQLELVHGGGCGWFRGRDDPLHGLCRLVVHDRRLVPHEQPEPFLLAPVHRHGRCLHAHRG